MDAWIRDELHPRPFPGSFPILAGAPGDTNVGFSNFPRDFLQDGVDLRPALERFCWEFARNFWEFPGNSLWEEQRMSWNFSSTQLPRDLGLEILRNLGLEKLDQPSPAALLHPRDPRAPSWISSRLGIPGEQILGGIP